MENMVSIIIPAYNMAKDIEICLKSIFAQTSERWEVIVVDDGSTDGTAQRVKDLAAGRKNVKVLTQKNAGSGPARNLGISNATGDYLFFADADDELTPDCVEKMLLSMGDGSDMLVFGFRSYAQDGRLVLDAKAPDLLLDGDYLRAHFDEVLYDNTEITKKRALGAPWNKLFRRETVIKHHLEYPALRRNQDEVFLMRYLTVATSVRYVNHQLYTHYLNSVQEMWKKFPADYYDIVWKLLDFRVQIMYGWNNKNQKVLEWIAQEFTKNSYNAFKQVFNPNLSIGGFERYRRLGKMRRRYLTAFEKNGVLEQAKSARSKYLLYAPLPLIYRRIGQMKLKMAQG